MRIVNRFDTVERKSIVAKNVFNVFILNQKTIKKKVLTLSDIKTWGF